ncbi:MAG: hypothetical protein HKN35_01425 [Woeseia sp.]|nr:hypothetical protein [Woeseia sp.]NNE59537.1 hypothetical protein [Woeseia sp.]
MLRQKTLTVLVPIADGQRDDLCDLLTSMQEENEANIVMPFAEMKNLHFARWSIVRLGGAQEKAPRYLLFACVFDGSQEDILATLCSSEPLGQQGVVPGECIDRIYSHCEGFGNIAQPTAREAFLRKNSIPVHTFYIGAVGRTVEQIRTQSKMRDRINAFLKHPDRPGDFGDPLALHGHLRRHLESLYPKDGPESFAAITREADVCQGTVGRIVGTVLNTLRHYIFRMRNLYAVLALAIAYLVYQKEWQFLLLVAAGGLLLYVFVRLLLRFIRHRELRDDAERQEWLAECRKKPQKVLSDAIENRMNEDVTGQNALTSLIVLKRGKFRWWWTRLVFFLVNLFARFVYIRGSLAGIQSIHFGRWAVVRKPRALLFLGDYDGSWERYLGDFISESAGAMTAIWANSVFFPRTRYLVLDGAADEHAFKSYSRLMMSRTHVFYSAYKHLSVSNINENGQICAGVGKQLSAEEAEEWAQLLVRRFT